MNLTAENRQVSIIGPSGWFLLTAILIVFSILRIAWLNHLVIWDEAMTLCSVRAIYSGGHDDFSNWFWRHPPLFGLLMMLLDPLREGFQQRTVLLAIVTSGLNLIILMYMVWNLTDRKTAFWTAFFLAVLPGSVFFDVWIKTDNLAVTFGLLAVMMILRRKAVYSALFLGLALLSKETAVFYCMGVFIIALIQKTPRKQLALLIILPALISGWWFILASGARAGADRPTYQNLLEGILFAVDKTTGWNRPFYYYLSIIVDSIHTQGLYLLLLGLAPLALKSGERTAEVFLRKYWPLLILLPSIILISMFRNKVCWVVISLLPLLAPLQAAGMRFILEQIPALIKSNTLQKVCVTAVSITVVAGSIGIVAGRDYEEVLRQYTEEQFRGADFSREIAQTLKSLAAPGDRILLTSFHYWKGIAPSQACPVFTCYFNNTNPVLIRPHSASFESLLQDIKEYRLDWAVLSPEPGIAEKQLFEGFIGKLGLQPFTTSRAFIFKTTEICNPTQ